MNSYKVAVSDDDRYWREHIFLPLLGAKGHTVLGVVDLKETLALLDRHFFHVAIVDICLDPHDETNRDGLRTLEYIRKLDEGTRPIILTGHGTASLARESLVALGAVDFLEKASFDPDKFAELVERQAASVEMHLRTYVLSAAFANATRLNPIARHQVASTYGIAESQLEFAIKNLLADFVPLWPGPRDFEHSAASPGAESFSCLLWSRRLGSAVRVWLGKSAAVTLALDQSNAKVAKMQEYNGLLGAVAFADDAGLGEFKPSSLGAL